MTSENMAASKVFGQRLELRQGLLSSHSAVIQRAANAVLHVILNQGALSQVKNALYGLQLLGEVQAGQDEQFAAAISVMR
jgi:hypothetical protein